MRTCPSDLLRIPHRVKPFAPTAEDGYRTCLTEYTTHPDTRDSVSQIASAEELICIDCL